MRENLTVGISTENHKLASLLFEKIIPLNSATDIPKSLCFPLTARDPQFRKFQESNGKLHPLIESFTRESLSNNLSLPDERIMQFVNSAENTLASDLHRYLKKSNVRSVPIFHTADLYDNYLHGGSEEAVEITLFRAPVIDTSGVDWNHILEIRKDKDFNRKLRNFRLFLTENYEGKDAFYVRDSLEKKMEAYHAACKTHGLQLILTSVSQTLDSNSLLGYLGMVTLGILSGQPLVVGATVVGGVIIEVGKMTVQVAQKQLEYRASQDNIELAYLIKLNKLLKKTDLLNTGIQSADA